MVEVGKKEPSRASRAVSLKVDDSFTQGRKVMNSLPQRILTLLRRVDLRRNPLRAIHRRIAWRLRWKLVPNKLWLVRAHGSFPLLMTRSGAGALIYYQGASEPETANFIKCTLKPGMVFVDVGAHIGEYTILAAELVRPAGGGHPRVPHPPAFYGLLQQPPLQAPVLIFEYGPLNMERFGYSPQALITFIRELGYLLYTWQNGALVRVENGPVLEANSSTCNLVAAKMPLSVSFS